VAKLRKAMEPRLTPRVLAIAATEYCSERYISRCPVVGGGRPHPLARRLLPGHCLGRQVEGRPFQQHQSEPATPSSLSSNPTA
jgi:hypothetical protein